MKSNTKFLLLSLLLRWVSADRRKTPVFRMLFLIILTFSLGNPNLFAQLPTGFIAKKLTTNNIRECVAMAHAPDGRIFIAERGGILKQLLNGTLTTVHTVTTTTDSEQGLLGIALHSNFAQNGKCYLYYTNPTKTLHYLDVIVLNAQSQVTSNIRLMEFDPIINGYHNGGAMVFKGNYLYICIGESNQQATAQDLTTYMGKVLRLQEDGLPAPGNPYYNTAGANRQQKSIWAIGMRNPWYMSMDPQSQKLYVINVGGGYEEINDVTAPDASKNYDYGWGSANRSGPDQLSTTIYPIFAYNRSVAGWNAQTCAVTGGLAFNPTNTNYPAQYRNKFYFTDWCTGWMRSLDMNNPSGGWQEFFPSGFDRILGLSTGIDGNIYYSEYAGLGNIWRLEYTLAQTPLVVNHPLSQTVYAGDNVTLSVTNSGTAPFTYQWKKNGVNIAGATASSYSLTPAAQSDAGTYSVKVTNAFGEVESNGAVLTVNPFNAIPVVDITAPATSTTWAVGEILSYAATATDAEDGIMPASAFQWEIQLFHKDCPTCEHSHPGPSITSGVKNGTFTADNGGETSSNIWLRVFLRITDSQGRTGIDSVDIQPKKVNITVESSKPGLDVVIGSQKTTPYTKSMVINTAATMVAVTPQLVGDSVFTFSSWNHGGGSSQDFRVPPINTTYKANFSSAYNTNINVALNKQATASTSLGGNVANSATDGNATATRWESQFADPQWIYVDLGATYSITRVRIVWENAKGKDYRIEISNDPNNWGTPVKTVSNNADLVNNLTDATGTGRYVRMYGTARTTGYGFSIFEFEVYGVPFGGTTNQNPTALLTAPTNNASFAAPATINLTATANDADGTISKVEFYNGATKLGEDLTSPYSFAWNNVAAGTYALTAKAIDNLNGTGTSAVASVTVTGSGASNIALNKQATAFTSLGGNVANSATDGNTTVTRWESEFADPQWIYVDLGARYDISQVKIIWEDARGKDFQLFVSDDINNWGVPVKTVADNVLLENNFTDIVATGRYVRMYGTARVTAYGFSIFELEVYGTLAAATNQNPTASLTAPLNNANFTAPAALTLTATASDADGTISKVEFYNGATKLGEDLTAPYSLAWNNIAAGTYALTARAIDNQNGIGNSATVSITVTGGATTNLALSKPAFSSTNKNTTNTAAKAVDGNATGSRWESEFADPQWFYVDLGATYNVSRVHIVWENAKGKDYQIFISNDINNWGTAVKTVTGNTAADNNLTDAVGTGRYVRMYGTARTTIYGYSIYEFEVYGTLAGGNAAPTVSLTAPANNAAFTAPASITLTANASDSDGTVSLVEFYNNGTKIGEDATAPYSLSLTNVGVGTYSYTAKATDNAGSATTSSAISATVASNALPTVSITAPANNASFAAPASITITANAADADGSVSLVEFFNNGIKIGEDVTAPYSLSLTNVAAGSYSYTAKATDNLSASATSSIIVVTVTNPGGSNLALGKPAFSSSNENAANAPNYAVDGNATGTRWSSQFADPQWFYVDLGATYNINRVKIVFEAAKAKDYQLFISNDINNWGTPVKTVTGNTALVNDLTDVTGSGRYVRFYGTARTTAYGYSFFEFEVYGTSPLRMALQNTSAESASDELAIYPNPFTDEITLKARFSEAGFVNVLLTDQNGYVVYDHDFENAESVFETKIGFANLNSGVYTLKLFSGKEVFSGRLIKQ